MIDYIFYSRDVMRPLGVLGPLDPEWFRLNKVKGCPHPHVPSDHLPLLVEVEMSAPAEASGARSLATSAPSAQRLASGANSQLAINQALARATHGRR